MTESLGEALPKRMAQVREMIPICESLGPGCDFIVACMKADLQKAETVIAAGDVVGMIDVYRSLMDYKL
jgi:hypothetical protein